MKLDLINYDKSSTVLRSDIKYTVSKFPDGQRSVEITGCRYKDDLVFNGETVEITARLNSFIDLEIIICANRALKNLGVEKVYLHVPYFLGARSDRKFSEGGINYLKDVICPIINSQGFASVRVLDPHSDVLEACLDNFTKDDNVPLVRFALNELYGPNTPDNFYLVSPDGGALKKIHKVAEKIGYMDEIIVCSKHRGIDGKLSKTSVPLRALENATLDKDLIIIDDICDGGRTFINIAEEVRKDPAFKGRIYLIVTHGIFSAGFDALSFHFDGIFCTNSIEDIQCTEDSITYSRGSSKMLKPYFIKQLRVV